MKWNKIFWTIVAVALLAGTLSSCASRKGGCNCPGELGGKTPKSYKRNVY
jgi:hypothetical protein